MFLGSIFKCRLNFLELCWTDQLVFTFQCVYSEVLRSTGHVKVWAMKSCWWCPHRDQQHVRCHFGQETPQCSSSARPVLKHYVTMAGSKVKKKAHSPELTFPSLCLRPSFPSAAAFTPHTTPTPASSPLKLPHLVAQAAPGGAAPGSTWTEGSQLMDSILKTADEMTAQRYMDWFSWLV